MLKNVLTIGQLAKQTGTTAVTIRYYERHGLIPPATRSQAGYRLYPKSLIPRFRFIHNAKSVGFSLSQIKELLALQNTTKLSQPIKAFTLAKIDEIQLKMTTLQIMLSALEDWADACDGKATIKECPILENLYKPSSKEKS